MFSMRAEQRRVDILGYCSVEAMFKSKVDLWAELGGRHDGLVNGLCISLNT